MHAAKKVALWSFGTLLSTVVAAVLFLAVAGDDFYHWVFRQAVEGAIDRKVHVDGSFSLDLGWNPTLSVSDVWLENAAWSGKKELARAERIEVQVALEPLLSGILRVPRLVIQGVEVELERSAADQRNWDIGKPRGTRREPSQEAVYPLLDKISLSDISVRYHDQKDGRTIILQLETLEKSRNDAESNLAHVSGAGSVNQRPFKISAQLGTIEDAIAGLAPYPLDVELQSTNFTLKATGTVADLPAARGLDVSLDLNSPSLAEMLRTLQMEAGNLVSLQASMRLKGDLVSLSAEEIDVAIAATGGKVFKAKGRIADLTRGEGLDLRIEGEVDPKSLALLGETSPRLEKIAEGLTDLHLSGHLAGSLAQLMLQDIDLQAAHSTGAGASLQGQATAGLSGERFSLTDFVFTTHLVLPDEKLLVEALNERIPPMTKLEAAAELVLAKETIELRSARVTGTALSDVAITGKGKVGSLSAAGLNFALDVALELKGKSGSSRPLPYLFEGFSPSKWHVVKAPEGAGLILQIQQQLAAAGIDPGSLDGKMGPETRAAIENYQRNQGLSSDGRATAALLLHLQSQGELGILPEAKPSFPLTAALPDFGPIDASIRLEFKDQVFRFRDLDLTLGGGATEIRTSGYLGRLHDGPESVLSEISLKAEITLPSSQILAGVLPPEAPVFQEISGRFELAGTENLLSLSRLSATAKGPSKLRVSLADGSAQIDMENEPDVRALTLGVAADWPDTASLYNFIGSELPEVNLPEAELPELGPAQARATIRHDGKDQQHEISYRLEDIEVAFGDTAHPMLRATGSLADVAALSGLSLAGELDLKTDQLLKLGGVAVNGELGSLRGRFELSDSNDRLGLHSLDARIEETELVSLSLNGRFDDLVKGDGLSLAVTLNVPELPSLGRKLNFDAENLGAFSYDGELSGSIESFAARGKASLGDTRLDGSFSGSLSGQRPAVKGKISSPLVRLADLGMVPDGRSLEEALEAEEQQPATSDDKWVFDEAPIPFETLQLIDLDLDLDLQRVQGVDMQIDQIEGRIELLGGQLRIDPLSFEFVGGQADATLHADAREDQPQVQLKLSANNVDLAKLLSQTRVQVPLDGTLDVILDLKGKGGSPRALASSLNGNTQLALADGHVLTGLLTLTTVNPVSWVFTESARKGYSKLNCLILRFEAEDGLARSQVLLLDTPNMLANGTGQIDLHSESLAIDVVPHAKQQHLVPVSIPFSIEGRLADPSISINKTKASLRTSKEVLLSPLNLLGSLLPFVGDSAQDNPCLTLKNVTPPQ